MKILHLLQSNRFSGAENVVCQIIGMFRDTPDVEMVYASRDGQIRDALSERGVIFVPIKELSVREVKRVIREQKPDIIHAHDMGASFTAARACGKIPLISHIHNNNLDSRSFSLKSIAYFFAARKAKHVFWVSNSSYEGYCFHKSFAKKSQILYNIIDVEALYRKMKTDTTAYDYDVVYVGRLTYAKNPQRLMHVLKKVAEALPKVKVAIVGTGDLEEATRELCTELKLDANVHFLGFQSNPLKLLHDAKLMIMTSRYEGTPMCALEAMALGVPVISTPTDGLCELIDDGKNGYLSDDDEVLANRMVSIITDTSLREVLSTCARNKAKRINAVEPYKKTIFKMYRS